MARALHAIVVAIILPIFTSLALPATASAARTAALSPLKQPLGQPNWSELNPQQRQILAPLAKDWDGLESFRRKKWLGIAQRYPAMTPEQQQRVQIQMKPWASLSPEERNAARERFKRQHKATQEQRDAKRQKWEEYKALPESEKQKLREKAAKNQIKRSAGRPYAPRPLTRPAKAATIDPSLSGTAAAR